MTSHVGSERAQRREALLAALREAAELRRRLRPRRDALDRARQALMRRTTRG